MLNSSLILKIFSFGFSFAINPFIAHSQDTDNDGVLDAHDLDDDNDGVVDLEDGCLLVYDTSRFTITSGDSMLYALNSGVYGATLDITRVDNSFNIEINGTQLTSGEMEFHAPIRTVEFADGTYYGGGGISSIWSLGYNPNFLQMMKLLYFD